ncbi:hypothetical protein R3W88_010497 [Solanum pinnatisectum]|uniref:RBR-type E3 ubiquitin transferase n=1 Tax=Solanum pinnatisectum TaxID=50273 RepID=A0AAV9MEB9_9SOLN|nr:hypothetical protein R3W88_010497 [Solanum pinnatisectum]
MAELDRVDEFYFSALFDHEEQLFPISDEMYAEELQLQEALYSAATISVYNKFKRVKKEPGESSGTFCSICTNNKLANGMFATGNCSHSFCVNCVTKYVTRKIVQENVSVIKCPDIACKAIIKSKFWREIVPKQVLDQLKNNALFSGSMKLHCPYKDCSAMLVDNGSENVIDSECPNCLRLFCAQCNVSWHEGLECKDFQHLGRSNDRGKGDVMLLGIAKNKKWRKCPKCKCYVEKGDGCLQLTCRCGHDFFYCCGMDSKSQHICPST